MARVRTLIADDSVIYRNQIKAALSQFPWIEIVGSASNGQVALEWLKVLSVDLLILDLEMPEMDGLQALTEIARTGRLPALKVVMFASPSLRSARRTLEALRLGAVDFIAKPDGTDVGFDALKEPVARIQAALMPKVEALFPQALEPEVPEPPSHALPLALPNTVGYFPKSAIDWEIFRPEILVIGSSTGGPNALEVLFSQLQGPFAVPICIVQHMPPLFTATLAERLGKLAGIIAKEPESGEVLQPNHLYLAPGGFHMSLTRDRAQKTRLVLDQGPQQHFVRPAVDPLFESAARLYGRKALGVVLTGMGSDGQRGAQAIKQEAGVVVIQERQSCVVYGMPGAVEAVGAFDKIYDLEQIVQFLRGKIY